MGCFGPVFLVVDAFLNCLSSHEEPGRQKLFFSLESCAQQSEEANGGTEEREETIYKLQSAEREREREERERERETENCCMSDVYSLR